MFDNNDMHNDPFAAGDAPQNPVNPEPAAPKQPETGSYYSPRSNQAAGEFRSPVNNQNPPQEPPVKKNHKGLRAMAVFACVAFIAYASIQCYQFALGNDSIRSFLGKQNSSEVSEEVTRGGTTSASEEDEAVQTTKTNSTAAKPMSFIDLASRENAMSIPDIVKKVTPATVGVSSTFEKKGQVITDPFGAMFGWGSGYYQEENTEVPAAGTGIIMSDNKDGTYYILTNAHVIYDNGSSKMGEAKAVKVLLNGDYYDGETELEANILEYNIEEDIAVLSVKTDQELTVAEFGNSDEMEVGELVVAIGNPLGFELFGSVSTGIVSALNRQVTIGDNTMRLIQTDTAINSGNSGGPLINSYGQVIGINSSKMSSTYYSDSASIEGLCFAIPINHAREVVNSLINYGYVTGKPTLNISAAVIDSINAERFGLPMGVYVKGVEEGGAADLAGIQKGDIIIAVNDQTISTFEELKAEKDKFRAGDTITLTVVRNGENLTFDVTLQEQGKEAQDAEKREAEDEENARGNNRR